MEKKIKFDDTDAEIILLSLPFLRIHDFIKVSSLSHHVNSSLNKFPEYLQYYVMYMKQNINDNNNKFVIEPNVISIKSTYLNYINRHVKLFQEFQLKEREHVDAISLLEEITNRNFNFNYVSQNIQNNCLGFDPLIIKLCEKFPSTIGFIFVFEKMIYYDKLIKTYNKNKVNSIETHSSYNSTTENIIIEFYKGQFERVLEAATSSAQSNIFNIFTLGSMGQNLEVSYSAWGRHNPIGFRLRDLRHSTTFSLEGLCLRFENELTFLPKLSIKFPVDIWTSNINNDDDEVQEQEDDHNHVIDNNSSVGLNNAKSFIEFLDMLRKETLPTCVAGPSIRVS